MPFFLSGPLRIPRRWSTHVLGFYTPARFRFSLLHEHEFGIYHCLPESCINIPWNTYTSILFIILIMSLHRHITRVVGVVKIPFIDVDTLEYGRRALCHFLLCFLLSSWISWTQDIHAIFRDIRILQHRASCQPHHCRIDKGLRIEWMTVCCLDDTGLFKRG